MKPQVVIVGRPNVGKSSLVNRLAGRRVAVVEEHRGVTRDRKAVEVEWSGVVFDVVDTGGWLQSGSSLEDKVSSQAERALDEANLVLLVVDSHVGLTEEDQQAARWVLRRQLPVMLIANKVDSTSQENSVWDFIALGLGEPFAISALHGRGAGDLLDRIVGALQSSPTDEVDEPDPDELRVGCHVPESVAVEPGALDEVIPDHRNGDDLPVLREGGIQRRQHGPRPLHQIRRKTLAEAALEIRPHGIDDDGVGRRRGCVVEVDHVRRLPHPAVLPSRRTCFCRWVPRPTRPG